MFLGRQPWKHPNMLKALQTIQNALSVPWAKALEASKHHKGFATYQYKLHFVFLGRQPWKQPNILKALQITITTHTLCSLGGSPGSSRTRQTYCKSQYKSHFVFLGRQPWKQRNMLKALQITIQITHCVPWAAALEAPKHAKRIANNNTNHTLCSLGGSPGSIRIC